MYSIERSVDIVGIFRYITGMYIEYSFDNTD